MLSLNHYLVEIYAVVAVLFLCGFLLRVTKLYPGDQEPLILDLSAVVIALIFAAGAYALKVSGWRFCLIFCSSLIIFPHFVYISRAK